MELGSGPGSVTREMVYLCIGEDMRYLQTETVTTEYFRGIKYYRVGEWSLIRGKSQIHCSCGASHCWHIFALALSGLEP